MRKYGKSVIVINEGFCKGCAFCINVCPQHLMRTAKHISKTGYHPAEFFDLEGKCTGCGLCALMCPDVAIEIYREKDVIEEK
ncbi:MAG: Ketoisovalerate oxidoreductase subunit VorC [Candidatus Bathyarchaeota archaeon BA1]|nr:MAG: Ketoisovalerate oxidoreductase subunit VorC [Candidatus Bathyarchaeota archaeon BA1]